LFILILDFDWTYAISSTYTETCFPDVQLTILHIN
jgi:hypothetical protein